MIQTRERTTRESVQPTPMLTRRRRSRVGFRVPWWYVLPALSLYLFVETIPSLKGALYSFTDWDGFSADFAFIGFENYQDVFTSGSALHGLTNTVGLALGVTLFQNICGLALAVAIDTKIRSRHVLTIIFFTPVVLTPLVSGYVWGYLLSPDGTVNSLLAGLGLADLQKIWLGDPNTALICIGVAIVWQFSGYSMVIYLAGLRAVPNELKEAAQLDGAGPWRRFWAVTFPLINGALVINFVLTLIGTLGQFDQVMAMTGGGPGGATETISTVIYKEGMVQGRYAYAVALAVLMAILVAVLAFVQYRLINRQVTR